MKGGLPRGCTFGGPSGAFPTQAPVCTGGLTRVPGVSWTVAKRVEDYETTLKADSLPTLGDFD
ncbi:hypothetical protein SK1NUM_26940 [Arachnia rubra]|nr:hypothetical protein SK1NUM_26940 [Arachnia rubra]